MYQLHIKYARAHDGVLRAPASFCRPGIADDIAAAPPSVGDGVVFPAPGDGGAGSGVAVAQQPVPGRLPLSLLPLASRRLSCHPPTSYLPRVGLLVAIHTRLEDAATQVCISVAAALLHTFTEQTQQLFLDPDLSCTPAVGRSSCKNTSCWLIPCEGRAR